MSDIVERLIAGSGGGSHWMELHREAAEEIKQLRKIATIAVRVADSAWQEKSGEYVFPQIVMLELDAAIRERIKYEEMLRADA